MTRILQHPSLRDNIHHCLRNLINTERQKTWYDSNYKHAFWDSLDYYAFDYLFNVSPSLWDDGYGRSPIGVTLYNDQEVKKIAKLLHFMNYDLEGEMPDSYYVNHPEWPKFMSDTKEIVDLMQANNEKYNFEQDLKDYEDEHYPDPVDENQDNSKDKSD